MLGGLAFGQHRMSEKFGGLALECVVISLYDW